MKRGRWLAVGLATLTLLVAVGCEAQYSNPPPTLTDSDLAGTWEDHYVAWGQEWATDRLLVRADGTFKQVYHDYLEEGYVYETPWNQWRLERFPDGRVRVHFQGARPYAAGIEVAEMEGLLRDSCPDEFPDCTLPQVTWPFFDPIADESIEMVGELVLNVQIDSSGEVVLLPMLVGADSGWYNLFTGKAAVFFGRVGED